MAAARDLHPVQRPRWGPEECRDARRQPLGLGERVSHRHGGEWKLGGIPCAVRDLPRRHRPGRRTRRPAVQDEREYRCQKVGLRPSAVGRRPLSDRRSEQPDAPGGSAAERPADGRHELGLPGDHAAGGSLQDESREHAGHVQFYAVGVRAEPASVQRSHQAMVVKPALPLARDGGYRLVRCLQRHGEPGWPRAGEPRVHRQVRPAVRHFD